MKRTLVSLTKKLDNLLSIAHVSLFNEKKSLVTFLFHGLFKDESDVRLGHVAPQQAVTIEHFRQFIEYYLKHDYQFISPNEIINELAPNRNYALITFDDGYYNNHLALSILEEYKVPAVFFISTNHILQNKCFWWDIIYRERLRMGFSSEKIDAEIGRLKLKKNDQIEDYIKDNFGDKSLNPISDIDRPFTHMELRQFSKSEFVHIGNHTSSHAILTNYGLLEIKREIQEAQKVLKDITGNEIVSMAYPNGNFTVDMIPIFRECGIKLGITVLKGKNYFPININKDESFLLKRFTLWGNKNVRLQCALFRSDLELFESFKRFIKKK